MADGLPPGWRDFDPEVVAGIRARRPDFVRGDQDGGLRCPLVGHDEWLPWATDSKGTIWHHSPALRFHRTPTYVLRDPLDNMIAGHALIEEALTGAWGKAETGRLGNENSEDAVTWNVFRSFQESDALRLAMRTLVGIEARSEPILYFWGRGIGLDGTRPWDQLVVARNVIEPRPGQQTEPDCCLHVPGEALVVIEAKFGSSMTSKASDEARDAWFDRYDRTCPEVLDRDAIRAMPPGDFPEQILRNVLLGLRLAEDGEDLIVVALAREAERRAADRLAQRCLRPGLNVRIVEETWESLYGGVESDPNLVTLTQYLDGKSYGLSRAFRL